MLGAATMSRFTEVRAILSALGQDVSDLSDDEIKGRLEKQALQKRIANREKKARPDAGFFLGLQDDEDPDQAAADAARIASNAMTQKALAERGAS